MDIKVLLYSFSLLQIPTSTLMKKDQHNPSHGIYNPHSNHILHDADQNYINSLDGIDYLGSLENNDMNNNDYDDQDYYYTEDPEEYHSQVMNIENDITDDMHKIQSNNNILDDKTKIYGGQQTQNFFNESGDNTIRYHPKDSNSIDKSDHLLEPHSDTIKSFDFEERERDTDYVNDNIGFKHDEITNKENVDNEDNHPLHFDDEVKKKGNCPGIVYFKIQTINEWHVEKKRKSMKRCVKVCRKGTCSTKCKQCKDGSCQEVSNQDLIDKIMELNKFT